MNFVRGDSTDTHERGERYRWSAAAPRPPAARKRTGDFHDGDEDDSHYFDDDEEVSKQPAAVAADDSDDPLDAFMADLQSKGAPASAPVRKAPRFSRPPPAPTAAAAAAPAAEQEEEDPLDAYMANLASAPPAAAPPAPASGRRAVAQCDEELDPVASYMAAADEAAAAAEEEDAGAEERSARRQLKGQKGAQIGGELGDVDHDTVEYEPFERAFYKPHPTVREMSDAEVRAYRSELNVSISGFDVPAPIKLFEHLGLSRELMSAIRRHGYEAPTPIQCQALPVALSGRDVIGVASTGSGKTCAYLLPMATQIMSQRELAKGEGPIGLVVAPTHELVEQITIEARRLTKPLGLRVTALFGGVGKFEQFKQLKAGSELVVGTPGRLIELIGMKGGLSMGRVTFVVLDEADRMFSLGFEAQVRAILKQVRPDRQTLLFSATFQAALERLARDFLAEPVRVAIGHAGDANEDVTQVVEVLETADHKWGWLLGRLDHFQRQGTVLIFVSTRAASEDLAAKLSRQTGQRVEAIHGDRTQGERQEVLRAFKKHSRGVLVATDVASRGLDIPAIKTVINYEVARQLDDHTHRIGRTGRAGYACIPVRAYPCMHTHTCIRSRYSSDRTDRYT